MPVGAVVDNKVHDNIHVSFFCFCQKKVEFFHGAETFVYFVIVGNIVSLIDKGRLVDGGKPQDINAQLLQVIELADDPP